MRFEKGACFTEKYLQLFYFIEKIMVEAAGVEPAN